MKKNDHSNIQNKPRKKVLYYFFTPGMITIRSNILSILDWLYLSMKNTTFLIFKTKEQGT